MCAPISKVPYLRGWGGRRGGISSAAHAHPRRNGEGRARVSTPVRQQRGQVRNIIALTLLHTSNSQHLECTHNVGNGSFARVRLSRVLRWRSTIWPAKRRSRGGCGVFLVFRVFLPVMPCLPTLASSHCMIYFAGFRRLNLLPVLIASAGCGTYVWKGHFRTPSPLTS